MAAINVRDLRAGRGGIEAVHGVDLTANAGEVTLLLGPNGAGKTTTLLTIAGVIPALGGQVEVLGRPVRGGSPRRQIARGLAYVPEDRGLFDQLTVRENLLLRARRDDKALADALEPFPQLSQLLGRRVGLLSGGEQQMLALACALALRPKVLLIDEMTLGLAPRIVSHILPVVREVARSGIAVLLVEQHIHTALTVADRCVVLQRGHITYSGVPDELRDDSSAAAADYFGGALDGVSS
ncbi:ABC transporter ATP-binding protein [Marmoricola sp. RAF53]|uniref:ABC transporter ATP-binding protein n=1 Tax=Marmoricola sp. RAF53 TaxID=3233059 RepID=UPI003F99A681